MEYPKAVEKIILKEGSTYDELKQIIVDSLKEIDQEVWEIEIETLMFPVKLSEDELFELIEFFFLNEYDQAVYVNIYSSEGKINIECDRHFGGFMLALTAIFSIGVIIFMVMMLK